MRELVLDIETVPCSGRLWRSLPEELKKKYARQDEDGDGWSRTALDWSLGRITCIGLLIAEGHREKTISFCGPREAGVLAGFWRALEPDDLVVGYNLLDFDLPFIQARSVINRVPIRGTFDLRRYRQQPVCDLMQVWAHWQRDKNVKLELMARILGLEGKSGSGKDVFDWYRKRDWKRIERYCLQDVRLTHQVYRRLREFGLVESWSDAPGNLAGNVAGKVD